MRLVHGARPTARPAVPRRRARANGGASALLPAAAASCARNSQGRRATLRVGVHARRGAGEGGARRAAHMFRAPPPEARGVAARGNRAAIPRAGASLWCTHSCGALCCRPGRALGCVTYGGTPTRPVWISMTFFHMGFAAQNPTWGFYTGINYCEFLLRTVTRPIFHMGFPTFSSERHRLGA